MSDWKPVSQPPEVDGVYLVVQGKYVEIKQFARGEWFDIVDGNYSIDPVTHWMPLPDLPNTTHVR